MRFSYLVIDEDSNNINGALQLFENFPNYFCAGVVKDNQTITNQIIKLKPQLIIIRIPIKSDEATSLFKNIIELFQYAECIPYFIGVASSPEYALEAIQSGFSDYIIKPLQLHELGKMLFRFEKRNPPKVATTICIKSYSDYQFVALQDVAYLKADNNTTDIHMDSGKTVNAYKTLKHFESTLPFYFLRIHKSYIVNINHVSRIHFSKSKCYLNYNEILPFSLTYKDNIDAIIRKINI